MRHRSSVFIFLHLLLFTGIIHVKAEDLRETEIRVRMEIEQAEQKVAECKRVLEKKDPEVKAAQANFEKARDAFLKSKEVHDKAQAKIDCFQGTLDASTAALDEKIKKAQKEYDDAYRAYKAHDNDSTRNELMANEFALRSLQNRRDKMLAGRNAEQCLTKYKAERDATEDDYWRTYGEYYKAGGEYEVQNRIVESLLSDLAKAEAALLVLRTEAVQKLQTSSAPFLESVEASENGKIIYRARWVPAVQIIDERIAFMKEAIKSQSEEVEFQRMRRDEWLDRYVIATNEVQAKLRDYDHAIWVQCFKAMGIEFADVVGSVLMDWKSSGPYSFVFQAVDKVYDAVKGSIKGEYDKNYAIPGGARAGEEVEPPPFTGNYWRKWFGDAAIDRYKSLARIGVEAMGNGELESRGPTRQAELWTSIKRRVFDSPGEVEMQRCIFNPSSPVSSLRKAFREISVKEIFDYAKKEFWNKKRWAEGIWGFGSDVMKDALKASLNDMAKSERLAVWDEFMSSEVFAQLVLRQLHLEAKMLESEHLQLKGYLAYLKDLIDERERVLNERRLKIETDEVASGKQIDLELCFNLEVSGTKLAVSGTDTPVTGSGKYWHAKFAPKADTAKALLSVTAADAFSRKPIDSQPGTIPGYLTDSKKWTNAEEGPDQNHRIKLRPEKPGVSTVLLIDCSRSMSDNNKMANARNAAKSVLKSSIKGDDEVALWAFFGAGNIQLMCPFTQDVNRVAGSVDKLQPNENTPLADAILMAGRYAVNHARNQRKLLMILSDGEETCNGNPAGALRQVQGMGVETR